MYLLVSACLCLSNRFCVRLFVRHALLISSSAPQMSKSPLSLLAGQRVSRTWRPCATAYQSCLTSAMLCLQTYAHTNISTHFILDSHHPAMLGDGDTRQTHSRTHSTLDSHCPAMLGNGDTRHTHTQTHTQSHTHTHTIYHIVWQMSA